MIKKMLLLILSLWVTVGEAFCPLCFFAAGAGIGLSQYLGIDDLITGLWIGGGMVSLIAITAGWGKIKNIPRIKFWLCIIYYGGLWCTLNFYGLGKQELNKLWGVDRLILGIIWGSLVFYGMHRWYLFSKYHNHGKAYFPYQKVLMPISGLLISSIIGWFL